MFRAPTLLTVSLLAASALSATAQANVAAVAAAPTAATAPVDTHEVHADGTITFRYVNPTAAKVLLTMEGLKKPLAMAKDVAGIWSVTTAALTPNIYGYNFVADGNKAIDPKNALLVPNLNGVRTMVTVPGTPAAPWELSAVPHGRVDHIVFTTHQAKNLPLDQSDYFVYTPPGYDAHRKAGYPVLYLLHGYSDSAEGWTSVGRANFILDSLIASGKAVPMIVVMPLGYGDYSFFTKGFARWENIHAVDENVSLYDAELQNEVIPQVESAYHVARGRENRAIAGLSMGGLETLTIGLHHTDEFAYIAGMSSALSAEEFDSHFPGLDAKKANLKLLWVSVGVDDHLLQPNRDFVTWARAKGFAVTAVETPGAHEWPVWRGNLAEIAPRLFK